MNNDIDIYGLAYSQLVPEADPTLALTLTLT